MWAGVGAGKGGWVRASSCVLVDERESREKAKRERARERKRKKEKEREG